MNNQLHGMVLFGHGARDPRWAEPFERLAALVRQTRAEHADTGPVALAFLELMTPDLSSAIGEQVGAGCSIVTVVPVFFGQGAHLRRDLPALLEVCRTTFPGVDLRCASAVGESQAVLAAISQFCIEQLG